MNKCSIFITMILIVNLSNHCVSQPDGQSFCNGDIERDFFPLDIKKKKIIWSKTYYFETMIGEKEIKGDKYIEYLQQWENGRRDTVRLRNKRGEIIKYEKKLNASSVFIAQNKKVGTTWYNADKTLRYKILSRNGKLKTPYCNYKGLLVVEASDSSVKFVYYYLKGYGYIGATHDDKLISFASPEWD